MAGAWAPAAADGAVGGGTTGSTGPMCEPARTTVWDIPCSPAAAGRARRELGALLDDRGLDPEDHDAVLLVVHELLVNGIEHGRTAVRLAVELAAGLVRIDVHDGSAVPPRLQPMELTAPRGRGLQMVDSLAARWGWRLDGDGKTVWAEVSARGGHPDPAA